MSGLTAADRFHGDVMVFLVRHGASEWNRERRFQGWADIALSDEGRYQATALSHDLKATSVSNIWSSDLLRAIETSRLIGWEPTPDPRLRELDFGVLEGSTWDELDATTQDALVAFDGFVASGGESVALLQARVIAFLDDLDPGRHLVVTHAGPFRVALQACGLKIHPRPGQAAEINWTKKKVMNQNLRALTR